MKTKNFVLLAVLMLFFVSQTGADVTPDDIAGALKKNLTHPYMYFTEEDKPAIRKRIKNDQDFKHIMDDLLVEANRYLYTPVDPDLPVERSRYSRYYSNFTYDRELSRYTDAAFELAFVYQMTGDERYARKAFEFADAVCDQQTWVNSNHDHGYEDGPPVNYYRPWVWNVPDDKVVFHYELSSSRVSRRLAAVYDWLYPMLRKNQRDRIRGALLEKAILRVRGNYDYHWWPTAYRCNWCAVCNSGLGLAAVALLTEDPQLVDVITESYNRISKTLDEVHDGGWQEGMSYLNYTYRTALMFTEVCKNVTQDRYNLYKHPCVKNVVNTFLYCEFPPNMSIHFSDSGSRIYGSYNMYNQLMVETGNRQAAWLRKHYFDDKPTGLMDLFKPKSSLEPDLPDEASIHFSGVGWVIMRSDFTDPKKVVVAAKSDLNNDPHHGHLDQGHFCIYWCGKEFICDHGSAGYDERYFLPERWDYPLASSIGHNVVFVNGEKQIPGKLKDQPMDEGIGGKVLEFRSGNVRDYTLLDPTNAYPKKELKGWRRHIVLEKPVITVVLDEVTCAKGSEIEVRFHSPNEQSNYPAVKQLVKDGYALLDSGEEKMALIPCVEGDFTLRPEKHAVLLAYQNMSLRWVPYVDTVIKARKEQTVIASIILPVDDTNEAQSIVQSVKRTVDRSGNLTLTFTKSGKTYTYRYKKGQDGLVLE